MGRAFLHSFELDGEEWMLVSYAPPRPAALAALTASELEVVDLWLTGRSMRAIARARGVAYRTVAKQIASSYQKLGVSSRSELLALVHGVPGRREPECAPSPR